MACEYLNGMSIRQWHVNTSVACHYVNGMWISQWHVNTSMACAYLSGMSLRQWLRLHQNDTRVREQLNMSMALSKPMTCEYINDMQTRQWLRLLHAAQNRGHTNELAWLCACMRSHTVEHLVHACVPTRFNISHPLTDVFPHG